jgi:hypothetical protein
MPPPGTAEADLAFIARFDEIGARTKEQAKTPPSPGSFPTQTHDAFRTDAPKPSSTRCDRAAISTSTSSPKENIMLHESENLGTCKLCESEPVDPWVSNLRRGDLWKTSVSRKAP